MALKIFDHLKNTKKSKKVDYFVKHLVVGADVYVLESVYRLLKRKQIPKDQLAVLTGSTFFKMDEFQIYKGPSTIRGEHNSLFYHQNIVRADNTLEKTNNDDVLFSDKPIPRKAVFYKDQKFNRFGSRMRPEKLLEGEDFYTQPAIADHDSYAIEFFSDEQFMEDISSILFSEEILKINFCNLSDHSWEVEVASGKKYKCEHLHMGFSPYFFYKKLQSPTTFSPKLAQMCCESKLRAKLTICFEFEKVVTDMKETIFIPVSYTHERGHFIGEFLFIDSPPQVLNVIHFFDPDLITEEDLSSRIRSLKRNLKKIFPAITDISFKESIKIEELVSTSPVDDQLYQKLKHELPNLHFIGADAPLLFDFLKSDITEEICPSHHVRALLSLNYIEQFLS